MCEGEFESLKAIHAVTPDFVPKPYAWGKYRQEDPETYFLLAEFREVGKQVRAVISQAAGKHVTHSSIFHAQRRSTSLATQDQPYFPISNVSSLAKARTACKSYSAGGWTSRNASEIGVSYWKIWLSYGHLPCQDRPSSGHLGGLMVCSIYQASWTRDGPSKANLELA